jgi:type II pantothenate kinase
MNSANLHRKSLKIINGNLLKIGLDIGGSLTKLSVILHKESASDIIRNKFLKDYGFFEEIDLEENFLYIKNFPTSKFNSDTINFLKQMKSQGHLNYIYATGGGAYKFYDVIEKEFGIKLEKNDELLSLVKGYLFMNYFQTCYELTGSGEQYRILPPEDLEFPHLSINVGSGVSILKVTGIDQIQRVGGTLMGGGTLIGLSKLLINQDNYNDIMNLAKKGDNNNLDLLVKDIYGTKTFTLPLEGDVIASSFGKIHHLLQSNEKDKIKKEDIAKSLLVMICYHIAQLAFLFCKQYNIKR